MNVSSKRERATKVARGFIIITISFRKATKTRCALHPILVTTVGLKENSYSGIIQAVITADDLFV